MWQQGLGFQLELEEASSISVPGGHLQRARRKDGAPVPHAPSALRAWDANPLIGDLPCPAGEGSPWSHEAAGHLLGLNDSVWKEHKRSLINVIWVTCGKDPSGVLG